MFIFNINSVNHPTGNNQHPEAISFFTRIAMGEQLVYIPEKVQEMEKQLAEVTGIRSRAGLQAVNNIIANQGLTDVNHDGQVDPEDLIAVYRNNAGTNPEQPEEAVETT